MPYRPNLSPNGTITTSTSNNVVTGVGTKFVHDLSRGSIIANLGNVFVGYVSYVTNNTSLVLTANSNLTLNSNSYHLSYLYANLVYNYNTIGNIRAFTANANVMGNGTTFLSSVKVGQDLIVANTQVTTSVANINLGRVGAILSDTLLYLEAPATANAGNIRYWSVNSQFVEANIGGPVTLFNKYLFDFTQAGLQANASMVHSYHPPIADPVTGVLVNLPATIANTGAVSANVLNHYTYGQGLNSNYGQVVIEDFDRSKRAFGNDIMNVHDSLHNTDYIRQATDVSDNDYDAYIQSVVPATPQDAAAAVIGAYVPRVTDNKTTLQSYLSKKGPTSQLLDQGNTKLDSNQDTLLRREAQGLKYMRTTGVPISVPGLLNAVSSSWHPENTVYRQPQFYPSSVSINYLADQGIRDKDMANLYSTNNSTGTV
jgi:hypothetical protein